MAKKRDFCGFVEIKSRVPFNHSISAWFQNEFAPMARSLQIA
jgi:hypothetical protein